MKQIRTLVYLSFNTGKVVNDDKHKTMDETAVKRRDQHDDLGSKHPAPKEETDFMLPANSQLTASKFKNITSRKRVRALAKISGSYRLRYLPSNNTHRILEYSTNQTSSTELCQNEPNISDTNTVLNNSSSKSILEYCTKETSSKELCQKESKTSDVNIVLNTSPSNTILEYSTKETSNIEVCQNESNIPEANIVLNTSENKEGV